MYTTDPFLTTKSVLGLAERVRLAPPPQVLSFTGLTLKPTEVDLIESFVTKGKVNSIAVWGTTTTGTYLFHGIVENVSMLTVCYLCTIYPSAIDKRLWVYKVTIPDVTGAGTYSIDSEYFDF